MQNNIIVARRLLAIARSLITATRPRRESSNDLLNVIQRAKGKIAGLDKKLEEWKLEIGYRPNDDDLRLEMIKPGSKFQTEIRKIVSSLEEAANEGLDVFPNLDAIPRGSSSIPYKGSKEYEEYRSLLTKMGKSFDSILNSAPKIISALDSLGRLSQNPRLVQAPSLDLLNRVIDGIFSMCTYMSKSFHKTETDMKEMVELLKVHAPEEAKKFPSDPELEEILRNSTKRVIDPRALGL